MEDAQGRGIVVLQLPTVSASLRDVGSVRKHEHVGNETGTDGDGSVPIDARVGVVHLRQVPQVFLRAFNRSG